MITLRKWIILLRKRASRNKPTQKEWETVDQCTDDDERKGDEPCIPQKGPEHFIPFPKR